MSEDNENNKPKTFETDFGFVGVEDKMDMHGYGAETLNRQTFGAEVNITPEEMGAEIEVFGGLSIKGDAQIGMRGTKNLIEETAVGSDVQYSVNAVTDVLYSARAGGVTSSLALQAEADMLKGHLNLRGEVGYQKSPNAEQTGAFIRGRADYDFSKDQCTGLMEKGCLTNIAQASFGPEDGFTFRNEFLHDIVYQGQNLQLRAGPSVDYSSEDKKVDVGVAVRASFEF